VSRLFNPPLATRVQLDPDGRPTRLLWRGRWESARVANTWRLEDEWWQGAEHQVRRDYYRLVLGQSFTVLVAFRDLVADRWYVEKVLD
jgi:hypothetical protein